MKNILFLISMLFLFSCEEEEDFSTPFYVDENGVTVKAKDWVTAGTTGELNGIFYTAVNIDTLRLMFSREEDVSKVVTTLITDMSYLFSNAPVTPCTNCLLGALMKYYLILIFLLGM